ncbi:hypothetical response regulator receiver protein [Ceraceosorus bombacis]|uniref:Hypothetical response regulator receiver protein n=1 Tax=Ceraceosorus bombacis TaxID=401625 RepID=A0A0P1BNV2_9BASI|nr:hypothetical response regulator receiver protein [Ceraceosorus bombacis]
MSGPRGGAPHAPGQQHHNGRPLWNDGASGGPSNTPSPAAGSNFAHQHHPNLAPSYAQPPNRPYNGSPQSQPGHLSPRSYAARQFQQQQPQALQHHPRPQPHMQGPLNAAQAQGWAALAPQGQPLTPGGSYQHAVNNVYFPVAGPPPIPQQDGAPPHAARGPPQQHHVPGNIAPRPHSGGQPYPAGNHQQAPFAGVAHPHAAWQGGQLPSVLRPHVPAPPQPAYGSSGAPGDPLDGDLDDDGDGADDEQGKNAVQKGASDFVKKLYRMLTDNSYATIVSWSPAGDSFLVKNMSDFTKHVLPRHFRHSNFASFVRQLNKYDFHKVKNPGEHGQGVDQVWGFKHPDFQRGREDLLENVKRKLPSGKKAARDNSPSMPGAADAADKGAEDYGQLKDQVAALTATQDQMTSHMNNLTKQYQGVIGEMLTFQRNMLQQDQLMQQLIQYLMQESSRRAAIEEQSATPSSSSNGNPGVPLLEGAPTSSAFMAPHEAQDLISSYTTLARDSFAAMNQVSARIHAQQRQNSDDQSNGGRQLSHATLASLISGDDNNIHNGSGNGALSPKSSVARSPAATTDFVDKGKASQTTGQASEKRPPVFLHPPHFDANEAGGSNANDLFNAVSAAVGQPPNYVGADGGGLRVFTVGTLQPRAESGTFPSDGSGSPGAALLSGLKRSSPGEPQSERRSGSAGAEGTSSFGISVPELEQLPLSMPRVDRRASTVPTPLGAGATSGDNAEAGRASVDSRGETPSEGGSNMLRVRRSTYIPGWSVPPKVLVVDDNEVCRKMSSKFLQVFGCAIDVAVDGVNAVNKMNLEKYDLVLMDVVMPNLDGVSATSLIRQFDPRTPIISMTSNVAPEHLLDYMKSGMDDVLAKPFSKQNLLSMLEKHLIHLKTVQKMEEIPHSLGLPRMPDDALATVLSATAASAAHFGGAVDSASSSMPSPWAAIMGHGPNAVSRFQNADTPPEEKGSDDEESTDNPLAGMGFSDEEYISMLQNLVAAGAVSDDTNGESADTIANALGVIRGEGVGAVSRSKESTPTVLGTRKRSQDAEGSEAKRSRPAGVPA